MVQVPSLTPRKVVAVQQLSDLLCPAWGPRWGVSGSTPRFWTSRVKGQDPSITVPCLPATGTSIVVLPDSLPAGPLT